MSRNSITLVGRATALDFRESESGATMAAFNLTIKKRGNLPQFVIRCEGYGKRTAEQFEQMDEGCLVGVIGTVTNGAGFAPPLVRIDRLEYLGKPVATVEG